MYWICVLVFFVYLFSWIYCIKWIVNGWREINKEDIHRSKGYYEVGVMEFLCICLIMLSAPFVALFWFLNKRVDTVLKKGYLFRVKL